MKTPMGFSGGPWRGRVRWGSPQTPPRCGASSVLGGAGCPGAVFTGYYKDLGLQATRFESRLDCIPNVLCDCRGPVACVSPHYRSSWNHDVLRLPFVNSDKAECLQIGVGVVVVLPARVFQIKGAENQEIRHVVSPFWLIAESPRRNPLYGRALVRSRFESSLSIQEKLWQFFTRH